MIQIENIAMKEASIEILVMLLGAFIIGAMFGWFLKPKNNQVTKNKETQVYAAKEKQVKKDDDFTLIEGIGPALEKILHKNGIHTFGDIVREDVEGLEAILLSAGKRYSMYNPSTWPDQAKLARNKKWRELEEYQEILNAGRKKNKKS